MEIINIPCCIDKNGADGKFCKSENAKICDVGTDVCRTITCKEPGFSVHHSNMVIVADLSYPESKTRRGRVQEGGDVCPTLTAQNNEICRIETRYRIRKLTPKECWRLMGFSDIDFNAAKKVNSNTQLYKQAGNSIVVNVLEGIFKELCF